MKTNLMFNALVKRYEADIAEAKAVLNIYFHKSVGIGEHPQHIEEMDKIVDNMASATDKLETLMDVFDESGVVKL